MARVLDKEKGAFLGAIALGGIMAAWGALNTSVSPPLDFGSRGPGAHVPVEPGSVPYLSGDFGRYWEEGGSNPFTLVSDRRDLPPSDIPLPPVAGTPVECFPPAPWPAGDTSSWACFPLSGPRKPVVTLGPEFDLADIQKLAPPPPAPPDEAQPAEASREDVVVKNDNSVLRGKIQDVNEKEIVIKTKGGLQRVPLADVMSHQWNSATPKQQYEKAAAKLEAKDVAGHQEWAEFCVKNGLIQEALAEWEKVLAADPKRVAACFALGDLYRRAMDLDGELGLYRRFCATGGTGVEKVWVRMAGLLAALGLHEDAVAAYEGGVKAFPVSIEAKLGLILGLVRVGRFEEAAAQAERAERQPPADPRCTAVRGIVELARGNDAAAEGLLPQASAATEADAALARGVLAFRAARTAPAKLADAGAAFLKAVQLAPTSTDAWVDLGLVLLLAGKTAEADFCFSTAGDMDPASSRAECGRGLLELLAGKNDEAAARFAEAAKRDPGDGYAPYALGKARQAQESADAAWTALLAAAAAGGRSGDLSVSLGLAALAKQDFADAIAFLEATGGGSGRSAELSAALGIAYLGRGDGDAAHAAFKEALKADPDNLAALAGLGHYHYFRLHPAEATMQFDAVLKIDPSNAYANDAKARVVETTTRTLWEDMVDRDDRGDVGRGWVEIERSGVEIGIKDKRARFMGRQGVKDDEMTSLERPVKVKTLLRFEAEIDVTEIGDATAGVKLTAKLDDTGRVGGVLFARNDRGKWAWCATEDVSGILRWTELPTGPDSPVFRMAIQRMETQQDQLVYALIVGDKLLATVPSEFLMTIDSAMAGAFGSAASGSAWTLYADGVRIIEKKPKKR